MKYFIVIFSFLVSCNSIVKKVKVPITKAQPITKVQKKTEGRLIVVLKDINNVAKAKMLIESNHLIWDDFLVENQMLKAISVKIPTNKKKYWIEKLKASNLFTSVEINTKVALEKLEYISKNTFIQLKKTHCSGDCPVYNAIFLKDGSVLFSGIESVPFLGEKEFKLSDLELSKLTTMFSKTSFKNYTTSFADITMTDFPSTFISYQNKQVEIKLWKNVPDELIFACEYLENILLRKKLIP